MSRFCHFLATLVVVSFLVACGTKVPPRSMYTGNVPPLESGWSRLKITSGKMSGVRLWAAEQVGPVFIDGQQVWISAKDEYVIVDLLPGEYELYWTPGYPDENFPKKIEAVFRAGETRHFACDMTLKTGAGAYFGVIGALVDLSSEYRTVTFLEERPMDNPDSTLVAYEVFEGVHGQSLVPEIESPPINEDLIRNRLERLNKLHEDKIIDQLEYEKKKQEILDEL